MLRRVETPAGSLYTLSAAGRSYLGYKNPWKPVGARFLARRYATRRLIEGLRLERFVVYRDRYRGSVLLWDADQQVLLLVAAYYTVPSKPTLWDLFRKGDALGAKVVVAYNRVRGRPFNLVRDGAIEYRNLQALPERPRMTLELVRAQP